MLLIRPEALARRRTELATEPTLGVLARRLEKLSQALLVDPLYFPDHKALLSRDGGSCQFDGARLLFDPLSPDRHECPGCGREFAGERHHRAWIWRYHLWLSERAIHLGLLAALNSDSALAERAGRILQLYVERYRDFPNRDNVLGPSRLFFSTYLESIWLLQLIVAAAMLELCEAEVGAAEFDRTGFNRVLEESAGLVSSFDEGWSNRQVWNNAAMVAAGLWLGRSDHVAPASHPLVLQGLDGRHGIRAQLVTAVGGEGLWFEGENYHFFALRGFLLAAELLRSVGIDLYGADAPAGQLGAMFVAPLHTVLPDLTLPARGDSPYGVSLLQPRFAELWEIGWARTGDERVESVLHHLYSTRAPEGDDPGLNEIAEQEQNRPAQRLDRTLLGWKALCWMVTAPPAAPAELWRSGSALLPAAGVAVMRTAPGNYVSVECGGRPGGHGHPDLLHLTLFWGRPALMDFGTASYVTPSLFWYRSTLAHNTVGVAGSGQQGREAWCAAFDQVGPWAWSRAVAESLLGPGTTVVRTVVVGPACVIDTVELELDASVTVDLALHPVEPLLAGGDAAAPSAVDIAGLGACRKIEGAEDLSWGDGEVCMLLRGRAGERLYLVDRPGPPNDQFADGNPLAFLVRRAEGPGTWQQCYLFGADPAVTVRYEKRDTVIEYGDGTSDRVTIANDGCRIRDRSGAKHKLTGLRQQPAPPVAPLVHRRRIVCPRLDSLPRVADWEEHVPEQAVVELRRQHYRRSEERYASRGEFRACVAVFAAGSRLCFACDVRKRKVHFRPADAPDPGLDNEALDVHSDGIQFYVGTGEWRGFVAVPVPGSESVTIRPVAGTAADAAAVQATWQRTGHGYRILVAIDIGRPVQRGEGLPVNFVVNEMYADRMRRAGQLVLSGGGGWVYLRGDREHPSSAVVAEVV
ncbi:MAG: heparinase II/III family protein [Gemmatimonadota bacterium]|nr:MAG: heparinase II/III family protein [Gemmatimonadota bacterium]